MTDKHLHHAPWSVTTQRLLLDDLQLNSSKMFVPCTDQTSKAAFRASLSKLFTVSLALPGFLLLWLAFVPFHVAHWFWCRRQAQPGWLLDFDQRCIQPVRQKQAQTCELTTEMGLLAHHCQIDITHPTRGPILTLFTAAPSADPQDALAMQNLALALAERLQLRLVGCRVALT